MLHIAVLEPDRQLAESIMSWLHQAGHEYTCCSQPAEFLACLQQQPFDLMLVDCGCDDEACFALIEQGLASQAERIPLLFISAPEAERQIVKALAQGADDFICKPLQADQLLSRIRVLLCRFDEQQQEQLPELQQFGPFLIDRNQHQLSRNGEPLALTGKDFCLADYLFTHPNQLLSRHRLLSEVWGVSQEVNTRTVDMHISRLRKSLSLEGSGYEIETVHQHGYRLLTED
ncbi:DNA-binding response regulator [Motiliproteus coralliicola]|uniref:DNA-binding response regulator n=1 Tax=Motiliproteus coralliicola TaxID=2283196 RepID=A0A369WTH9_9GAMM|nr:response regulator transcription factor [Motiliproteus coralliicola]RDE24977.1 DNA-binding response regulator [Motiliproteus coralliicola]